jgi:hypothetical protein
MKTWQKIKEDLHEVCLFHRVSQMNSFCQVSEALPGKSQHGEEQPSTSFT